MRLRRLRLARCPGPALLRTVVVSRRITRPVSRIIEFARAMGRGDRRARAGQIADAPAELRELAAAFDQMADSLTAQEQLRRNLVADVAHELRTPVAVPIPYGDKRVRKAGIRLSQGRELMYFGEVPERPDDYPDGRRLARVQVLSQAGGRAACRGPRHAAWVDRSVELGRLAGMEQVYCFENRGAEIGVTLSHPHGQIYAYSYVTPRTGRMLQAC
jgi:signal transduction histidine kinase